MRRTLHLFLLLMCLGFGAIGQNKPGNKKTDKRCHPYAEINGFKGAAIVKARQLSGLKSLEVINECKDGRSYTVMSFELTVIVNKKTAAKLKGKYGDLSPEMKKSLAKCRAGSNVVFSNIQVKSGDGKMEGVQGVTLHVK